MEGQDELKHIGILFRHINKEIIALLNKDLEVYGITLMQNEVLYYIYFNEEKHDINQKEIEKFFNSTNPTITGILNRLQAKELIKREASTEDARYKIIKLTEKGRALIGESHKEKAIQMEHRLTKNLTSDEVDQLKELLTKVAKGLKSSF